MWCKFLVEGIIFWFVGISLLWILVVRELVVKVGGFEFSMIFSIWGVVIGRRLSGLLSFEVFFILFVMVLYCLMCFFMVRVGGLFIYWFIIIDSFGVCNKIWEVCDVVLNMIWFFSFGGFWNEVFGNFLFVLIMCWIIKLLVIVILFVLGFFCNIFRVLIGIFMRERMLFELFCWVLILVIFWIWGWDVGLERVFGVLWEFFDLDWERNLFKLIFVGCSEFFGENFCFIVLDFFEWLVI